MIFVTVGTQAPFDRLVKAMDRWASAHPSQYILGQVGNSTIETARIDCCQWLSPAEFRRAMGSAELVVSHAGMGTILTARELGARLLVMPRRGGLGEHRDEHQFETALRLQALNIVPVAWTERDLTEQVDRLLKEGVFGAATVSSRAEMVAALRELVRELVNLA